FVGENDETSSHASPVSASSSTTPDNSTVSTSSATKTSPSLVTSTPPSPTKSAAPSSSSRNDPATSTSTSTAATKASSTSPLSTSLQPKQSKNSAYFQKVATFEPHWSDILTGEQLQCLVESGFLFEGTIRIPAFHTDSCYVILDGKQSDGKQSGGKRTDADEQEPVKLLTTG
ncbi:unnamed protein product, partial [Amoebophrya sp. A25]